MSSHEPAHTQEKEAAKQRLPASVVDRVTGPALAIQRAATHPGALNAAQVLQLQRALGNRAVGRLLSQGAGNPPIQRELRILDSDSTESPETVWNAYNDQTMLRSDWDMANKRHEATKGKKSKSGASMETPAPVGDRPAEPPTPWLKVRDLYSGVTMTGNDSWPQLVRQRHGAGGAEQSSLFTIFTGTHGNLGGQFVDKDGKMSDDYRDDSHTSQDKKTALNLMKEVVGCDIKVVDVFADSELRKPEKLRDAAKAEIAANRVVIFAWCYSMEAFTTVPPSITMGSDDERRLVETRSQTPLKDIVSGSFGDDLSGYARPVPLPVQAPSQAAQKPAPSDLNPHAKPFVPQSQRKLPPLNPNAKPFVPGQKI